MKISIICFLSSFIFSVAKIIIRFLPKNKLTKSLYYRFSWRKYLTTRKSQSTKSIHFHGASVGELEDIMPLAQSEDFLKQLNLTKKNIVISSSSMSGKNYLKKLNAKNEFLYAGPLPPENKDELRAFLNLLNIKTLFLSQNDLWPLHMKEFLSKNPHESLVYFLLDHKKSWKDQYLNNTSIKKVFLRLNGKKNHELKKLSPSKFQSIRSLRKENIMSRIEKSKNAVHPLEQYGANPRKNYLNIIIGSAWIEDLQFISEAIHGLKNLLITVVPHETEDQKDLKKMSSLLREHEHQIIAKKGILVESYKNFDLAWIGGSLASGLHNIQEALLNGVPSLSGIETSAQKEALELQKKGIHHCFQSPAELRKFLESPQDIIKAQKQSTLYAKENLESPSSINSILKALKS